MAINPASKETQVLSHHTCEALLKLPFHVEIFNDIMSAVMLAVSSNDNMTDDMSVCRIYVVIKKECEAKKVVATQWDNFYSSLS
jgi:hypothetical protein